MNRFRTKKKAKDGEDAGRPSIDENAPMSAIKSSKTFRLGKKQVPERVETPEIDLTNALPSSEDFRTSLLMNGLSARFSMLREQDDPNSKLGKASDDSVLFPKRQSRLVDFGFVAGGLADIAEVSSIHSSGPRPPFAFGRIDSYQSMDGYGTDEDTSNGSVMSRAKPAHGNNLFGGRQKIYKLSGATASTKSVPTTEESGSMRGRLLYDDDVSMSAFQKLREREKRQKEDEELLAQEQSSHPSRSNSPPTSDYNRNRETTSTTASGPSLTRNSTAATSVNSQRTPSLNGQSTPSTPVVPVQSYTSLERTGTKARRLYETGLDQHLHNQQFSAMSRLDSLSGRRTLDVRTPSPGIPSPTRATFNIAEEHNTRSVSSPVTSPAAERLGSFDFGVKRSEVLDVKQPLLASPPLSPPMSDGDESLLHIHPDDTGKATAAGVFTKPPQPYDDKKYTMRQLQMQQGRVTPTMPKPSSPIQLVQAQKLARTRAESNSTHASGRSESTSSAQSQIAPSDRNLAAIVINRDASKSDVDEAPGGLVSGSRNGSPTGSTHTDSDAGLQRKSAPLQAISGNLLPPTLNVRPPEAEHPALRQQQGGESWADLENDEGEHPDHMTAEKKDDNATLGPHTGLSGLVRQHLRTDSNASSMYGAPSPGIAQRFSPSPGTGVAANQTYNVRSNPWDATDWEPELITSPKFGPGAANNQKFSALKSGTPNNDHNRGESGTSSHHRDGSADTQQERDDFKSELATRRRRVQENLRSYVDPDARSRSPVRLPAGGRESSANRLPEKPANLMRQTASATSLPMAGNGGQNKANRMLGLAEATMSTPSPRKQTFQDIAWREEQSAERAHHSNNSPRVTADQIAVRQARRDAFRNVVGSRQQQHRPENDRWSPQQSRGQPRPPQMHRDPSRDRGPRNGPSYGRSESREGATRQMHSQRSPREQTKYGHVAGDRREYRGTPSASRERSSSEHSDGRSRSRNGGWGPTDVSHPGPSQGLGFTEERQPMRTQHKAPNNIPEAIYIAPTSNVAGARTDSKLASTAHVDSQQIPSAQTSPDFTSPRPSPITPFSVNATPPLAQIAPAGSSSTTIGQGFQSDGRIPAARKRSVNKAEISEPTFVSSTARMTTVNLDQASPLQNIDLAAPPVPDINPRRRQTRTQTMLGVFSGKSNDSSSALPLQISAPSEIKTSQDDSDSLSRIRQKLRKSSSEGGNLHAKARAVFAATPSPALPGQVTSNDTSGAPPQKPYDGGMF